MSDNQINGYTPETVSVEFRLHGRVYRLPRIDSKSEAYTREAIDLLSKRIQHLSERFNIETLDICTYAAIELIANALEAKDLSNDTKATTALLSINQQLSDILQEKD
ncbi:MAG: cell division protein ZapA [Marinilabiliaceae bacterium]|nr:cell division protein ZapA [Marinilabiliaceae bacterium]